MLKTENKENLIDRRYRTSNRQTRDKLQIIMLEAIN